jgi:sulfite exporter TauE/SafE
MQGEITFLAALVVGFLGSTHCLGMCGGIAGTLATATDRAATLSVLNRISYLLAYNLGRITSYVVAGLIAAGIGHLGFGLLPSPLARGLALSISVVFLLALGFYVAGWASFLPRFELLGGKLWRNIEPLGRRLMPVKSRPRAFAFGLVWGWLPCGLVYSVLVWAAATASPVQGALLMLGFGLGTLPTVLCMGLTGQALQRLRRHTWFRRAAGASLILFAAVLVTLYALDNGSRPRHQNSPQTSPVTWGQSGSRWAGCGCQLGSPDRNFAGY